MFHKAIRKLAIKGASSVWEIMRFAYTICSNVNPLNMYTKNATLKLRGIGSKCLFKLCALNFLFVLSKESLTAHQWGCCFNILHDTILRLLFCICVDYVRFRAHFVWVLLRFSRRYSCAAIVSAGNKGLANLLCHVEYFEITESTQSVQFKMTRLDCQYTILLSEFRQ